MSPNDDLEHGDPERRIQDLERPLSQSEFGTETPTLGQEPRGGLRIGWVVLGLMVAVLVVSGGLLIARPSTTAGRPVAEPSSGVAGGGGRFSGTTPATPASPPSVSIQTFPEIPIPPQIPSPPPSAYDTSINVAGIGRSETIDCADRPASISGVENKVVLTGHCGRVDVSGVNNSVTIDSADAIDVSGMSNQVRFHSGNPELSSSGLDNTLERG